jgi:tetratricopeptide (TPR) repeat protein
MIGLMEMTKRNKIILSAVVVLILLAIYIMFDRQSNTGTIDNEPLATTTTNAIGSSTVTTTNSGNYTIEQVPLEEGAGVPQPIPDLNRPIVVSSNAMTTAEATASARPVIINLQASLKKNPADFASWINLGISQKEAGDFEGASISWIYASKLAPNDYIALGNLGDLYAYFIKNNTMAESYSMQAIAKGSTQPHLYIQLAEVYVNLFNDKAKAKAIIEEGLLKIPNDPNLLQIKASLE